MSSNNLTNFEIKTFKLYIKIKNLINLLETAPFILFFIIIFLIQQKKLN